LIDNCCFCEEINSPTNNQFYNEIGKNIGLKSRIILQNDDWIVIPSLGSLAVGHLLAVSRMHYLGIADLQAKELYSLIPMINNVIEKINLLLNISCIVFEHGTTSIDAVSANSVTHCHIHIMPFHYPVWNNIKSEHCINNSKEFSSLNHVYNYISMYKPCTYLYFMDANNRHYIIDNNRIFPSQFFRKVIAEKLGREKFWDWKTNPEKDTLLKTLSLFS